MFTGLIETLAGSRGGEADAGGLPAAADDGASPELTPGDSLAVNGVCLTVVSADADGDARGRRPRKRRGSRRSASLKRGGSVNLERPMRADGRFGGHFVQGHVDATGTIEELRQEGDSCWLTVEVPAALAP